MRSISIKTTIIGLTILLILFALSRKLTRYDEYPLVLQPETISQRPPQEFTAFPSINYARDRANNFVLVDWGPAYWSENNNLTDNDKVGNCIITRNRSRLSEAHAVVIDIRAVRNNSDIPKQRFPWQLWVYLNRESPYHTNIEFPKTDAAIFHGDKAVNWTMTYRRDADVEMWHGRKVPLREEDKITDEELRVIYRGKRGFVTGSVSNCYYVPNHRNLYLKKLIELDSEVQIYGSCGNAGRCPGWMDRPGCIATFNYKFYLAFENSNCRDYITEKFWSNAFHHNAIPVVMGASKSDVEAVAPENSFIHVDDFESPEELLQFLHKVADDEDKFLSYLQWRHEYSIDTKFRQFGTFGWELVCDAMNSKYNPNANQSYPNLLDWTSVKTDCSQNQWIKQTFNYTDP